jgi:hypothetical protein
MQKIATITDLNKFPGAHHVSPQIRGLYVAYAPAALGVHSAIAILQDIGSGKYLVEAEKDVLDKLGATEDVQAVIDANKWPVYETVSAAKDAAGQDTTVTTVGAKPATVDGKISTKPALDSALGKLTALEYTEVKEVLPKRK